MPDVASQLERLGLTLPAAPRPVANYIPADTLYSGHLLFVSGQIPIRDGALLATGPVPDPVSIDDARACARQCVLNALAAVHDTLDGFEKLRRVVKLDGFVACPPRFGDQPRVIDAASELLVEILGDFGRHTRAAVGVSSLPLDAPVEIAFTFVID